MRANVITLGKGLPVLLAFVLVGPFPAFAHEGPPFPILMDKPIAGYVVSVWADPDIGDAQFYIIVEAPGGGMPAATPRVTMWIEPTNGRLDRATYETIEKPLRNQLEFFARPYFDQQDDWTVGIQVTPPGGQTEELTTEVESTPPGYGRWDFAIYLFPFVFLGGFWVLALVRRNRLRHVILENPTSEAEGVDLRKDGIA